MPPGVELAPSRDIPLWIGSWGSPAGLRRVARAGDGWLASAYNTTPERFSEARAALEPGFPNALATMWTWVAEDRAEADRVLADVLAPILRRDPDVLRAQVCVGPAGALRRAARRTTPRPAASACTCGRSATSRGSSSWWLRPVR